MKNRDDEDNEEDEEDNGCWTQNDEDRGCCLSILSL